jgi:hypothetical protein
LVENGARSLVFHRREIDVAGKIKKKLVVFLPTFLFIQGVDVFHRGDDGQAVERCLLAGLGRL